uniref:Glycosyltransferase family 28 N-terminal domain-containing protein n=1 Tax=Bionectria ochroleuca TaxID=29856 RepID=A0A8H7K5N2_BIOOC
MAEEKRVLMLTNAELGQANIFLAVSHELHVNSIGISSSSPDAKPHPNINFIPLHGPSWKEALFGRSEHQFQELCDMSPTVWNVSKAAKMTRIACPWTSEEVCALVKEIEQIIEDVKPTAVVVDNLFTPAVTVCYKVKPNWIVLSPNTYKEFILAKQPDQQYYWKYPPPRSTVPYPVPWYYWPIVWYMVRTMYLNHDDTWMTDHAKQMKEKIDTDYADWAYISIVPPEGLKVLLASRPEIDFPFDVMPDHITGCGPIVLPSPPLKKTDPDLDAWLSQHPTIYINTGEKNKKTLQVLWKLSKRGEYETGEGCKVSAALGLKFGELVRITEWIDPDPIAILTSGHIACSVNHGGANSFFDALSAGVPQVILPVWGDTYDFAKRVEWLGIGKFGSPWNAPQCSARELGPILEQVVLGPRSKSMKEKAVELAQLCENNGGGRRVAAQKILEML